MYDIFSDMARSWGQQFRAGSARTNFLRGTASLRFETPSFPPSVRVDAQVARCEGVGGKAPARSIRGAETLVKYLVSGPNARAWLTGSMAGACARSGRISSPADAVPQRPSDRGFSPISCPFARLFPAHCFLTARKRLITAVGFAQKWTDGVTVRECPRHAHRLPDFAGPRAPASVSCRPAYAGTSVCGDEFSYVRLCTCRTSYTDLFWC